MVNKGANRTAIDAVSMVAIIKVGFPPFLLTKKYMHLKYTERSCL